MRPRWCIPLILCMGASSACVEDAEFTDADAAYLDTDTPLLPWIEGNSWTYRVTDGGEVSIKTTTIGSLVSVGGSGPHASDQAYEVTTLKSDATDRTVSYQIDVDGKVLRYRELSFQSAEAPTPELEEFWDPYKLHIDGTPSHTAQGATWAEQYTETKLPGGGSDAASTTAERRDQWTVDQAPSSVTVPAGTFDNAIKFIKAGSDSLKTYWYVRGVGKVKETGGQTEELIEYTVTP